MSAGTQIASPGAGSRARRVTLGVSAVAIAAMLAVPGTALAARGGGSTGSWISLNSVSLSAAAGPSLGSTVTFATSYPKTVKVPRIEVACSQTGTLVYAETAGVSDAFVLGGGWSLWLERGGAADCVANLFYYGSRQGKQTYELLASTRFAAGG